MPTWGFFCFWWVKAFLFFFSSKITPSQHLPSTHNCVCPIGSWAPWLSAKDTDNAKSLHEAHRTEIIVGYWMYGNHTEMRKLPNSQVLVTGRVSCQSNTCLPFLPQSSLGICSWTLNLLPKEFINTFCHLDIHHAIEYPVFGKPWWSIMPKAKRRTSFL